MSLPSPVAIIGLGLMGGSLARDLAVRGVRVFGHDADATVVQQAISEGVIESAFDASFTGLERAQLVVLAIPVDAAVHSLGRLGPLLGADAALTDMGSTKVAIGEQAMKSDLGSIFVGSHPLAGDHRSGWDSARPGLFDGATVFLCPTPQTMSATVDRVQEMWIELGAVCAVRDAAEHDRQMAWISHLPQVVASALAVTLAEARHHPEELGPGGRDMTRLAGSSPEMWTAICRDNASHLRQGLHQLQLQLASFDEALREDDVAAVLKFLQQARNWLS